MFLYRNAVWTKVAKVFPSDGTALHQGLSKYLTAQDTHITPTLTKHNRTPATLGKLLSLIHGPKYK